MPAPKPAVTAALTQSFFDLSYIFLRLINGLVSINQPTILVFILYTDAEIL